MMRKFFIFLLISLMPPTMALDALDYEIAVNLYNAKDYKGSLKQINRIEKLGGLNAETCLLRYESYKKTGKLKEAKRALIETLKYDKTCYEAYLALAIMALDDSDSSLAKKYFKNAIDINPEIKESPDLLYYYAKICIINKDFEAALENILSALEMNGDEKLYYLELGKIYLQRKSYLRAVNALTFALGEGKETDAECYNYIGLANFRRGNLQQAVKYFEMAVKTNNSIIYLNNLAKCYKAMNEPNKCQEIMEKLYLVSPKTPEEFYELSQILNDKKDLQGAKKTVTEGLKSFPDNLVLKEALFKLNKL